MSVVQWILAMLVMMQFVYVRSSQPCVCPDVLKPICASDGKTYDNACKAGCAGFTVIHTGPCDYNLEASTSQNSSTER
jgi:hypothetical protein